MKSMTVLKISPLCRPEVISIPHTLEDMQAVVNGPIQAVYPFEDPVAIVCNEEGKLTGEEPCVFSGILIQVKSWISSVGHSLFVD